MTNSILDLSVLNQTLLSEFAPGHVLQHIPAEKLPAWWIQHHVLWATYTPVNAEETLWKLMMNTRIRVYSPRTGKLANVSADSINLRVHAYIEACVTAGKQILGITLRDYKMGQAPITEFQVSAIKAVTGEQSDSTLTLTAYAPKEVLFGDVDIEDPSKVLRDLGVLNG